MAAGSDGLCIDGNPLIGRELEVQDTVIDKRKDPRFELEHVEAKIVPFGFDSRFDVDPERTALVAESIFPTGSWTLRAPAAFRGIATVVVPPAQPDLVISIEGSLGDEERDREAQRLLMLALGAANFGSELGLANPVLFDRVSIDALAFEDAEVLRGAYNQLGFDEEQVLARLRQLSQELTGTPDGVLIGVETVAQPQLTDEDRAIMEEAARSMTNILETIGFEVTKKCDFCIRIFRIHREDDDVGLESDVLPAEQPPAPSEP